MATIKELVQKEAESFEKAKRLRKAAEKMEQQIKAVHEIAKEGKKSP